jgi:hypothetical protein
MPVEVGGAGEFGGTLRAQLRLWKHGNVPGMPPELFGHADGIPLDLRTGGLGGSHEG